MNSKENQLNKAEDGKDLLPVPKPTALMVAKLRGAHQLLDEPLVYEDPLALKILGPQEEASLRANLALYDSPILRGLRASVVVRSRLVADEWINAQDEGISQYLIMGAGLDTSAYRDQAKPRIFEIDLPETQVWKRKCLRDAGIAEPLSVRFVATNFEQSSLRDVLEQSGFDAKQPAFVSWLGVTMYIDEESVMNTLRFVASLKTGSQIIFDYICLPSLLAPEKRSSTEYFATQAAANGEPWKSYFDPGILNKQLQSIGFREVEDLDSDQQNERYLANRADGFQKSGAGRIVLAKV
jgi:methyltransferase (TIGR00027 family)